MHFSITEMATPVLKQSLNVMTMFSNISQMTLIIYEPIFKLVALMMIQNVEYKRVSLYKI